jgi:NAD(P)-dependent dehydrogenase (short-subunit alcohol dehydrogenase family)
MTGPGSPHHPARQITAVNYAGAVELLDAMLPALNAGTRPAAVVVASNSAVLVPVHEPLLSALLKSPPGGPDGDNADAGTSTRSATGIGTSTGTGTGTGTGGMTAYAMSKLALIRAVRGRAQTWAARGVRLNAVAPGPVQTPLLQASLADPVLGPLTQALPVPLGRPAKPAEIADVVTFLLGPASAYIHGSVLFADGGTDALLRPDAF